MGGNILPSNKRNLAKSHLIIHVPFIEDQTCFPYFSFLSLPSLPSSPWTCTRRQARRGIRESGTKTGMWTTSEGRGEGRGDTTNLSQRLWPPARPDCRRFWPWRNHSGQRAWWLEQWTSFSSPWGLQHPPSFTAAPRDVPALTFTWRGLAATGVGREKQFKPSGPGRRPPGSRRGRSSAVRAARLPPPAGAAAAAAAPGHRNVAAPSPSVRPSVRPREVRPAPAPLRATRPASPRVSEAASPLSRFSHTGLGEGGGWKGPEF